MIYTYDINDDVILYCHLTICYPIVFEEKKDGKWRITIDEETALIEKNDTWKLVSKQSGKKPIGVKWIYKEKKSVKEDVERYKARLMGKSYSMRLTMMKYLLQLLNWRPFD